MTHVEKRQARPGKETIHSGHFMVSHFEAEAQDEFDDLAVPVPDEEQNVQKVSVVATYTVPGSLEMFTPDKLESKQHQQLSIEISLTKLFKCMTLAYRQKLTSPKWNRFKGIKLRWKDKIRLNNVIWRCWHMQFIKKQNTLVCQFASPLDVDTHVKPETQILEGKYWKRRAEAVIAEYKKWRMFHIMRLLGKGDTSVQDTISDMDTVESFSQCSDFAANMLTDEDYLNFMSDTLFSTISNHQPFAFPDCREIARGASLADFIQPSLGPLQPNLDDFMDTLEPLQDLLSSTRLPPVPEESALTSEDSMYRSQQMSVDSYTTQGYNLGSQNTPAVTMPTSQMSIHGTSGNTLMSLPGQPVKNEQMGMFESGRLFAGDGMMGAPEMASGFQGGYGPVPASYAKPARLQYLQPAPGPAPQEPCYNKYAAGLPPSQTAPETVSLLQQPPGSGAAGAVGAAGAAGKYAAGIAAPARAAYTRDKTRPRIPHYQPQLPNNYQAYPQTSTGAAGVGGASGAVAVGGARQPSTQISPSTMSQIQYLFAPDYKPKPAPRAFKQPSPPLAPAPAHHTNMSVSRGKEQFRSHSLPLGAQLNADWTLSAPLAAPLVAHTAHTAHTAHPSHAPHVQHVPVEIVTHVLTPAPVLPDVTRHTPRQARESNPGANRLRSRSSSIGMSVEAPAGAGAGSTPPRRPPPLHSVASEPTLPQASVMLAQLLSAQHSQSVYKFSSSEDVVGSDPKSPVRRGQPSPIGSDVMSPHQSLSPPGSPRSPRAGGESPRGGGEPRRTHLHAEQKRRYNIKNGFDTLQGLIPHLNANPAAKISKAAMLQKGAEYIKQLKAERNQIKEEMESLKQQIECLNNSISNCHSLLPATGAPVSRARAGRLREMFARHVANRTMQSWKYWLFSVVSAGLVESFSACVWCGGRAGLVRATLLWAEQHCSLVEMRPAVLNALRLLCSSTDILTHPERLPDEARAAVAAHAAVKPEPS